MHSEVLLFWLILFGFLVFDNFYFIKPGQDVLQMSAQGHLRFRPGTRLDFARQELVWTNPLNLLDRMVHSGSPTANFDLIKYRLDCRKSRKIAKALRLFVFLGYCYLVFLLLGMVLSFQFGFSAVVMPLLAAHLLTWCLAAVVLLGMPTDLRPDPWRLAGLGVECLLVPAYLVNLNKILLRQHTVDMGALLVGLRERKKCRDQWAAELITYQLTTRLDEVKFKTDEVEMLEQVEAIRTCLKS